MLAGNLQGRRGQEGAASGMGLLLSGAPLSDRVRNGVLGDGGERWRVRVAGAVQAARRRDRSGLLSEVSPRCPATCPCLPTSVTNLVPSGYGCANINGQTCTSIATSTNVPTVTCDGNKPGPLGTQTVPDTKASITAFSLFAPMFQLNFQSTDLPSSSTSTSKSSSTSTSTRATTTATTNTRLTTSGTRTLTGDTTDTTLILDDTPPTLTGTGGIVPTNTPTLQENANNSTSTGSFSSAAKVAIGVGGAVAVLLAVVCGFFYVWRRRKARREEQELDRLYGIKDNSMSAGGDFTSGGDIPGWYRGQRLNTPVGETPFRDVGGGAGGGSGLAEMARVPAAPASPYYRPYRP